MLPKTGSVGMIRQQQPLGLGHAHGAPAILSATSPLRILLPDDLIGGPAGRPVSQMVKAYQEVGGGIIVAAEEKPMIKRDSAGAALSGVKKGNIVRGHGGEWVEKPDPAKAPLHPASLAATFSSRRFSASWTSRNAALATGDPVHRGDGAG